MILRTSLSPSESRTGLEAAGEPDGLLAEMRLSYGILVHAQDGRVWLRVRRPFVNNFLSPWLLVLCRPSPRDRGTLLDMTVRYEPLSIAFAVVIGLVAGAISAASVASLVGGRSHTDIGGLLPAFFGLFALAWPGYCVWLGRRDLHALIRFVTRAVAAAPIDGLTRRWSGPA